jgi:hypothetical protein
MASTKKKQQYRTQGTQAREAARTAGHAARRQIDLDYSRQRRQDTREERAAEEKFKGSLPIWGGRNPVSGAYEFRPGAKQGFWENRGNDWVGQARNAAEGQADWTKIQHPSVARQPNKGFGYLGSKAIDAIGSRLQRSPAPQQRPVITFNQPQALPVAAPGGALPAGSPAGGSPGGSPNQARLKVKPNSGQPRGPATQPPAGDLDSGMLGLPSGVPGLPSGMLGLPSGVPGLPPPGGASRMPGMPRRLPSNTSRPALGRGPLALGTGEVIETTATESSTPKKKRAAGMGERGKSRIASDLKGVPLQAMGNPWGRPDPGRISGTPVQSIGNPWAYDPRD